MTNEERLKLKGQICAEVIACEDDDKLLILKSLVYPSAPKKPSHSVNTQRAIARRTEYEGFGEKHTNAEWARRLGLPRNVVWRYIHKGMTIEQIVEMRGIKYPVE